MYKRAGNVFYTLYHMSKALGEVTLSGHSLYVYIMVYSDTHKMKF
jgi:hypothetical protein